MVKVKEANSYENHFLNKYNYQISTVYILGGKKKDGSIISMTYKLTLWALKAYWRAGCFAPKS